MKKGRPAGFIAVCIAFGIIQVAGARERSGDLRLNQAPFLVQKTIEQQKGDQGVLVRLQKTSRANHELYTAQFKKAGHYWTILLDNKGAIVEMRKPIDLSRLSPAARKTVQSSVGNGEILELESVQLSSGLIAAYRLKFKKGAKNSELRIAPNGRLASD
jgi:hypothetical protein